MIAALMAWSEQLQASTLATAVRRTSSLYYGLEVAHLIGIALLLGGIATFDLRLLGLRAELPVPALGRLLLRTSAAGLGLALASGALLFAARAGELAANPMLVAKLAVVALGVLNVAAFHLGPAGQTLETGAVGAGARTAAALSLLLWTSALVFGRLIAAF